MGFLRTPAVAANGIGEPAAAQAKSAPSNERLTEQAEQAEREGRSEDAIRLYLKALEARPEWAEGWHKVGVLLADRRDFARAETAFRNELSALQQPAQGSVTPKAGMPPNQAAQGAAWALLGLCEYEQGRLDEAYRDIQNGRTLGVGNNELEKVATYHAALVLVQKGEFPAAQVLLTRLARAGVDDPDLITAFGLATLRIRATPENVPLDRVELVRRAGEIEFHATHDAVSSTDTVAAYETLLREHPSDASLHYAFGNYLFHVGHYDRGLEEMKKVLELQPDDLMALLQMALTYAKINQAERGLPYAEKAVQLDPTLFAPHYALGWTLFKVGQNERAAAEIEQAVKLEPSSAKAHYALSEVLMHVGRKDEALRERKIFAELKKAEEGGEEANEPANPARTSSGSDAPRPE